jgi:alpha/beta superfamily hydrolase
MPEVIFAGSDGRLEGRYVHGKGPLPPLAMILHPHPQHGGTMNNKVVYTLYQTFVRRGFSVLRFNFRGVGRSQGTFDHGQGELRDSASALDWMLLHNPDTKTVWIAGFSFGSWIAMQLLMRRPEVHGFICAGLPANMYDFSFLAPCPSPGLIIHGGKDAMIPAEPVTRLITKLQAQRGLTIDFELIDEADHFFTNQVDQVALLSDNYLDRRLAPAEIAEAAADAT